MDNPTANQLDPNQSPLVSSFKLHRHLNNPCGPHQIEFLKTDAEIARWPSVGPVVDSKGVACQWVVSQDTLKSKWLTSLGRGIADILGISKNSHKEDWKLQDFPSSYQLFTYVKGTRQDQYLFGSTNVSKFRTVNEFLPHLQWLASDGTISCRCKYCSGAKNQIEINVALGLPNGHNTSPSKSKDLINHSSDRDKRWKQPYSPPKNNRVYTSYEFQGPYLSEELNRDLLENRSNFRKHELVWCLVTDLMVALRQERNSQHERNLGIKFWPGLCEEMILCTESRAFISIDDEEKNQSIDPRTPLKRKREQSKTLSSKPFKSEFETHQRYKWKIRLLGLADVVIREEAQILPWLFKTVDLKQKFGMKKRPQTCLPRYIQNPHQSTRPKLDSLISAEERLLAFQLALQTAANLEEFWVAHDRYDAQPDLDTCEKRTKMPHQINQVDSASHLPTIWFQGIWWGAEKIWLYDVVRLNDFKRDLAFSSQPRTPGDSLGESSSVINKRECYFLKIEGIYRDEEGQRLIVMGKIFDLVPSTIHSNPLPLATPPLAETKKSDKRPKRPRKWMPSPPTGFEFRQITKPKEMIHLHVECISGRFYPTTRTNQSDKFAEISRRLAPKVSQDDAKINPSFSSPNKTSYQYISHEQDQSFNDPNLVGHNASLFGLTPGQKNFMRCRKWRPSRAQSISDAEKLAEQEMILAYERLRLVDENEEIQIIEGSPRHLKSHTTTSQDHTHHHGNKKAKHQDQKSVVVIEIDP